MLQHAGSPRPAEAKARADQLPATTDFVHYVIHFAATREGRVCEMCRQSGKLEHTHYFVPVLAHA
jgi:hypothetical protein